MSKGGLSPSTTETFRGLVRGLRYLRGMFRYSLTVIGPNVYEADRFATAAFAMGRDGIVFIDGIPGLEGYMITDEKTATMTRGFSEYVA